jgi:thiamine biosynthesis lipoprotein
VPSRLLLVAALAAAVSTGPSAREVRVVLGTVGEIQVSGAAEPEAAIADAFDRITETEMMLSIWRTDSEISRLNRDGEARLSEPAFAAVERALSLARDSGGAFDPTLAPRGFERIELDRRARRVRLPRGVQLDLGAVVKGYAVDRALELLQSLEPRPVRALVDLGTSSIGLFGDAPASFEVRDPDGDGPPPATFRIARGAIGSSSRDQLGEHIRDPRPGRPPKASVRAVTVVSASAFEADGLSTAVFVLGAEAGLDLVARRGAEGLALLEENGTEVLATTPGFAARYALEVREGVLTRDASAAR